jgi:hypothetical protein
MAANGIDVEKLEADVTQAHEAVARQGDIVRGLKAELKDGRVVRVSYQTSLHSYPNYLSNIF